MSNNKHKNKHNDNDRRQDGHDCHKNNRPKMARDKNGHFVGTHKNENLPPANVYPNAVVINGNNAPISLFDAICGFFNDVARAVEEAPKNPVYSIEDVNKMLANNTAKTRKEVYAAACSMLRYKALLNFAYGFVGGMSLTTLVWWVIRHFGHSIGM